MKKYLLLFVTVTLGILLQIFSLIPGAVSSAAVEPELPRTLLDTRFVPPTGATINVPAGGDFQAALNSARPGDTIVLQAGATYTTPSDGFLIPNKSGSGWIVIRTSNLTALPAEGTRVGPSNSAAMPKIITPSVWPALRTAPSAHHYRFIGVEIAVAATAPLNYNIVAVGNSGGSQNTLSSVPTDIIFDRCYVHGNATGEVIRGIALDGARSAVIDSYISNCHSVEFESQAIGGSNGPGPFKITNNYLEATGQTVLFGGGDPKIPNLVPSDIEFRRNLCSKRLTWSPFDPSFAGIRWVIKNIFELKNAQRLLADGNIFENNWAAAQTGTAILFTPRNQDGTAPWCIVQDITFTNNIVRHTANGIDLLGRDDEHTSQQAKRIKIQNNLFEDVGGSRWGGGGILFQMLDGTADVRFDHNTAFQPGNVIVADGVSHTGFVYTNNLTPHNTYGIFGSGTGVGNPTLAAYFPGSLCTKNVLAGGTSSDYPAGNFFPATLGNVGFVDLAGGNYRLASGSPYRGAGTDGKDVGADIDAIQAAINGVPSSPPPPSPPPPTPPPPTQGEDVVMYAAEAPVRVGNWQVINDATAAGGSRIWNSDQGAAKLAGPLANPASYFEMTFNAQAGVGYRLWVRSKADSDSPYNDSFFVQFSGSVNSGGGPISRIGTTSAETINLEDCSGCGLSQWGWQDNGWGVGVLGPVIYFQSTGTQTLRIHVREDGLSIDQIVLSSGNYLNSSPGSLRNDNTILPESGTPPPPPPSAPSNIVIWAADIPLNRIAGNWAKIFDSTAAGQTSVRHADQGAAKLAGPLANPASYFEMTFNAQAGVGYRLWVRSKADSDSPYNDSFFVQFSGSVNSGGGPISRIGTTSAETINLEDCSGCGLSQWGWQDNGWGVGVLGPVIYFQSTGTQTLRIHVREDGVSIDQIVLSPQTFLNGSPGSLLNDNVILPRN